MFLVALLSMLFLRGRTCNTKLKCLGQASFRTKGQGFSPVNCLIMLVPGNINILFFYEFYMCMRACVLVYMHVTLWSFENSGVKPPTQESNEIPDFSLSYKNLFYL